MICRTCATVFPKFETPMLQPMSDYNVKRIDILEAQVASLEGRLRGAKQFVFPNDTKPIVDWSLYSRWYWWLAMNKSGQWYLHKDKPEAVRTCWLSSSADIFIPKEYEPNFTGGWEDSLCERPK